MTYFREFLVKQRIGPHNTDLDKHTAWFIDYVETCGGIAFVLEELARSYLRAEKPLPMFKVLMLNNLDDRENKNRPPIIKEDTPGRLFLPDVPNSLLSIAYETVGMPQELVIKLCRLGIPDDDRLVPYIAPCLWNTIWDYRLTRGQTQQVTDFLEYFDFSLKLGLEKAAA
jgi:hypothetical protein